MSSPKTRLWQQTMIGLACSDSIRRMMQGSRWTTSLAGRFVGGPNRAAVLRKVEALQGQAILASIYYLGEYVQSPERVEENVQQIIGVIEDFGQAAPSTFLSVDPTQIGYSLSDELGYQNALRIGRAFAKQASMKFMMIDMEDSLYVERTLALYRQLKEEGIPVAITLQTYLYRTEEDLRRLARQGAIIRLVKGAFVESKDIAWTKKHDIDDAYLRMALQLLTPEAKAAGVYPIFATHDDRMIDALMPELEANGWQSDQYEIEMLLGVREDYQRQLAREGHTVRVYVPFGTEWWPYTVRRIGENPANAHFVLQALLGK
jgi:proline dehydrogenase